MGRWVSEDELTGIYSSAKNEVKQYIYPEQTTKNEVKPDPDIYAGRKAKIEPSSVDKSRPDCLYD